MYVGDISFQKPILFTENSIHQIDKQPIKTESYCINSFIFRGSILWNSIPKTIKNSSSLEIVKNASKSWNAAGFIVDLPIYIRLYIFFFYFC